MGAGPTNHTHWLDLAQARSTHTEKRKEKNSHQRPCVAGTPRPFTETVCWPLTWRFSGPEPARPEQREPTARSHWRPWGPMPLSLRPWRPSFRSFHPGRPDSATRAARTHGPLLTACPLNTQGALRSGPALVHLCGPALSSPAPDVYSVALSRVHL